MLPVNPKIWADMSDAEKGALLLADHIGVEIQAFRSGRWTVISSPSWLLGSYYRTKPAPIVTKRVKSVKASFVTRDPHLYDLDSPCAGYVTRIIYTMHDGKPASVEAELVQ